MTHIDTTVAHIADYLQNQRDAMVADLTTLATLESPTYEKNATDALGNHLAELFVATGASVRKHVRETIGDILEVRFGAGEHQLLALCHIDTVFDIGDRQRNPVRLEGNRLYGPGVYDMKAGVVQLLWVLRALQRFSVAVPYEIVGLITTDEEVGSLQSRELIEQLAQQSRAAFVLEPAATKEGRLVTSRKGIGRYIVNITGKPAHSGGAYSEGISAVVEAANQIQLLNDVMDLSAGSTINPGIIQGGTRANIIAERATITLDTRFVTPEEGERLDNALRNLQPTLTGARLAVEGGITRPSLAATPSGQQLFSLARQVGKKLGLSLHEHASGGGSDANFTAAIGCPTLDGLGAVGAGAHTFDEYVNVDSMPQRAALLAGLILSV